MTSGEIGNFRFGAGSVPDEPTDLVIPESEEAVKDQWGCVRKTQEPT